MQNSALIHGPLALFFKRFLENPSRIGALCPSSRYLRRAMFAGTALRGGETIIELGPGTGAFTAEVDRYHDQGLALNYLGVETDQGMYEYLCRTYPQLEFELGDAADLAAICAHRGLSQADLIVCGIPLILMKPVEMNALLETIQGCLAEQGLFRTFSYTHCFPNSSARRLRRQLNRMGRTSITSVMRNIPPALVLSVRAEQGFMATHLPQSAAPRPDADSSTGPSSSIR